MKNTLIKYILCAAVLLTSSVGTLQAEANNQTSTSEIEQYIWLNTEGMNDLETSNEQIHKLITSGLHHQNESIVHCTVSTLSAFIGKSKQYRKKGLTYHIDRDLKNKKEWREVLIEMWSENWTTVGKVFPQIKVPDDLLERIQDKTGCIGVQPTWIMLPQILAYLYPQDSTVYEIIWDAFPIPPGGFRGGLIEKDNNPLPLLSCLFDGQFSNEKDQNLRIDLLSNRQTSRSIAQLAARSLGEFRTDNGLETLADTLQDKGHEYGTPILEIVESIMKYDAQASQYIPLIQENLNSVQPIGNFEKQQLATLKERFVHFEKKNGELKKEDSLSDEPPK